MLHCAHASDKLAAVASWLLTTHLLGVAAFFGATVFVGLALPAVGRAIPDPAARRSAFAALLRVYDPLAVGALGVAILTGAWMLTPQKAALGAAYFERVARPLAWKLGAVFVLVNLTAYVTFALGHRLVRAAALSQPVTEPDLDRVSRRLRAGLAAAVVLAAWTFHLALALHPAVPMPREAAAPALGHP